MIIYVLYFHGLASFEERMEGVRHTALTPGGLKFTLRSMSGTVGESVPADSSAIEDAYLQYAIPI